ncbi:unnamed protein product [Trifolium pratense]|uniref:Uncharacterized protein n=1 Tax=Trifolium pratense TaxID=57577 RepID=A0ACB0JR54_TRIPR|nr:unnamed protein product [Trifolium pratense]
MIDNNLTTLLRNSQTGSHQNVDGKVVPKATDSKHGSQVVPDPTTPLPDKKLLLSILDRLQKKDTHGVFSEPVDPKELPDYQDVIKDPMDFGTIRKKLDGDGGLLSLEQFEARTMQEIARKDFAVISHLFSRKAIDKEEEEITHNSPEDTSYPVTLDGIVVLIVAVISWSIVIARYLCNFYQWLDRRSQSFKGDVAVTTISLKPEKPSNSPIFFSKYSIPEGLQGFKDIIYLRKARQERLIPSNRPIVSSKYSRSADVQGYKVIQKAKTVF